MTIDSFLAVDNYMFEFMSSEANFPYLISVLGQYRYSTYSPSRSRIPLSPQSPHSALRSPQLKQKQQPNDSSSAFSSQILSTNTLPCIYNNLFSEKVGVFARATVFRRVPTDVYQLEAYILAFLQLYFPSGVVNLQQTIYNPFYATEVLLAEKYPDYHNHTPRKSVTYLNLIMESLFNIPALLSRPFLAVLQGEALPVVKLCDASKPKYQNANEIAIGALNRLYDSVRGLVPEQRFFKAFGTASQLTFYYVHALCLEVVMFYPQYEFVDYFIYQNAFAYTAAARLFYDLDCAGNWTLFAEQYAKTGVSIPRIFFEIQEKPDIAGESGIFGYEQFYVLYCVYSKYSNNDIASSLTEVQLRSYNQFYFSAKTISRVFCGFGRRLLGREFAFADFIVFVLSDVIIDTSVAARYWFGVADVDCDGVLSQADIRHFVRDYAFQWDRLGLEVSYQDVLRQMGDSIKFDFAFPSGFVIYDFLQSRYFGNFFSALFSGSKFQYFESRDMYIANRNIYSQTSVFVLHGDSMIWRAFWEQAYEDLVDDE